MKYLSISIYWDSLDKESQTIVRAMLEKNGLKKGLEIPDDQFIMDLEIPPIVLEEIKEYNKNKADYEKEITYTYQKNGK